MIAWFRRRYAVYRRLRAIRRIRTTFAMFGYDVSALSDAEIERGAIYVAQAVASAGATFADYKAVMARVALLGSRIDLIEL